LLRPLFLAFVGAGFSRALPLGFKSVEALHVEPGIHTPTPQKPSAKFRRKNHRNSEPAV
jgi:hypothetical protein